MDISAIVGILNRDFDADISADYYAHIEQWRQWWRGRNELFHLYQETQADGKRITRELFSLKMAKKVCEDWASILLNEKTEIAIDDAASSEFLQGKDGRGGVFADIGFWSEANALVEKAFFSGTGAFVMRVAGDTLKLVYLPADNIIPISVVDGAITEAAFASEKIIRGRKITCVEIHTLQNERYVVENRFYDEENGMIPVEPPDDIEPEYDTKSAIPFFSIIRPNIENPYPEAYGMGCAVFAQAVDCLKGVDLAFNNFCRDFVLGAKKVFYNRELAKVHGVNTDGSPRYVAPDEFMQQLFISVGDDITGDEKALVQEFNPSLRVAENKDGVQAQLDYLSFRCGLGTKHFRMDAAGAPVTATQYSGDRQELRQNAAKHGIVVEQALRGIVRAMLYAGRDILGLPVNPDAGIMVTFSDGYIISDEERRNDDRLDIRDGLLQPWEYRVRWYGEDEATAKLMAQPSVPAFGTGSFNPGEDEAPPAQ